MYVVYVILDVYIAYNGFNYALLVFKLCNVFCFCRICAPSCVTFSIYVGFAFPTVQRLLFMSYLPFQLYNVFCLCRICLSSCVTFLCAPRSSFQRSKVFCLCCVRFSSCVKFLFMPCLSFQLCFNVRLLVVTSCLQGVSCFAHRYLQHFVLI